MISIDDLVVTQSGFRNEDQIQGMIDFVAKGGTFDHASLSLHSDGKDVRLINIARFENGRLFIHDGHHRIAAIYLGGRKYITDKEFKIQDWKYSDYTDINFKVGWVTPYDPRIEVRLPDYQIFKMKVQWSLGNSESYARYIINESRVLQAYCKPRTVLTIQDVLRYI